MFGVQVIGMWEIGWIFLSMDMELIILPIKINTADNTDMESHGEEVNTYGFQELSMKEILKTVKNKAKEDGRKSN